MLSLITNTTQRIQNQPFIKSILNIATQIVSFFIDAVDSLISTILAYIYVWFIRVVCGTSAAPSSDCKIKYHHTYHTNNINSKSCYSSPHKSSNKRSTTAYGASEYQENDLAHIDLLDRKRYYTDEKEEQSVVTSDLFRNKSNSTKLDHNLDPSNTLNRSQANLELAYQLDEANNFDFDKLNRELSRDCQAKYHRELFSSSCSGSSENLEEYLRNYNCRQSTSWTSSGKPISYLSKENLVAHQESFGSIADSESISRFKQRIAFQNVANQ